MNLQEFLSGAVFQYLLVFARVGGALMMLPGFGDAYVPVRVRLLFALALSVALLPMLLPIMPMLPGGLDRSFGLIAVETGIGVFFGVMARILLMAVQGAGTIVALQVGFANAFVADPITAQQAAVTGNFLLALTLALIFATGVDHLTLRALAGTYGVFPVGELPPMGDVADHTSRLVAQSFSLAVQLSAPFLVYGIVFAVGLGLLSRLMPALQVFFVAMPVQLLGGIGLMAIGLSTTMLWFLSVYEDRLSQFLPSP
jgi:flagellar biosynthetic protein FliR